MLAYQDLLHIYSAVLLRYKIKPAAS